MFLGEFKTLHGLIEPIHLGENVRAVQADRGDR
jgi:hypothetical protein